MSHYFTDNRQLPQNRKEFSFRFSSFNYLFTTDNGVFCKNEVDFGTWVLLNNVVKEGVGDSILDLGCGYGPVGVIVKHHFPQSKVIMCDINSRAVELAKINCKNNQTDCDVRVSNRFSDVNEKFDTIITNPPIRAGKDVIYAMFDESYEHLNQEGCLYVVIRKQQGAKSAQTKIASVFGNCDVIDKEKGYYILKATKND